MVDSSVLEAVERIVGEKSIQSRFKMDRDSGLVFFTRLLASAATEAPEYIPDTRNRDTWMRNFVRSEPFVNGIISSVIQIDKNRGWNLIGGRNQVIRFARVLEGAEQGAGWRFFISRLAEDFYQTDIGGVTEVGSVAPGGPLMALWNMDSTLCQLTGNSRKPLRFYGGNSRNRESTVDFYPEDYFRVVSKPNADQNFHGAGYSALSRAFELARVMMGILQHSQEKLATRVPKGFLSVFPIEETEWKRVEEDQRAAAANEGVNAFDGVVVLRSPDHKIEVEMTSLSQLPDKFDFPVWVETVMTGYSLIFGYPVHEFWTTASRGFSRGSEVEVQSEQATGKGTKDFTLQTQDQIQSGLPPTVSFEFQERDEGAELERAEKNEKLAKVASVMYTAVPEPGAEPLLDRQRSLQWLAMHGVIPHEWAEENAAVVYDDEKMLRSRIRDDGRVRHAAERFPNEPIVCHSWPNSHMRVLYDTGTEMLRRRSYPVAKPHVHRRVRRATLYESDGDEQITDEDVDSAIESWDFPEGKALLEAQET